MSIGNDADVATRRQRTWHLTIDLRQRILAPVLRHVVHSGQSAVPGAHRIKVDVFTAVRPAADGYCTFRILHIWQATPRPSLIRSDNGFGEFGGSPGG
ncbi:MAG: hypothetical protein K0Q46_3664 [Rhodococcus erythropolis]|nr:hypothetical protein [Rhodococcus erythropolis]